MKFTGRLGLFLGLGVLIIASGGAVGGFFLAHVWNPWPAAEMPAGTQGENLESIKSFAQVRTRPAQVRSPGWDASSRVVGSSTSVA